MRRILLLPLLLFALAACDRAAESLPAEAVPEAAPAAEAVPEAALAALDSATVRAHLETLSADDMEGRGTGTPGERRAVEYIAAQMQAYGLEPAGKDGSFFQAVPLLGSRPTPRGPLTFTAADGRTQRLDFIDDFIVSTDLEAPAVEVEAPLVFVGYGITAPGYDWDSYKGVDVKDKIVVMFVNDPVASDEEPALFQADTLTYFGRWTYKYEEARRRGAKGALLIHTVQTAGYPFAVLSNTARNEQIQLATPPANPLALKGWITREAAEELARLAGTTLEAWFAAANDRAAAPQELPVRAALAVDFAVRRFEGTNVVGKLPGRARAGEAVVYTAHHDHLGMGAPNAEGDAIYNGAEDNATGVAMLLTMAKAYQALPQAPERSVLFVSLTAEESGLLGAEYYVRNPAVPNAQVFANINLDGGNVNGRTEDVVGLGAEKSELGRYFAEAAAAEGLRVTPDPNPNQGFFFRSDQLAFARAGIPAVFINTGRAFVGQPDDYAQRVFDDYNRSRYHQPADEFDPSWPLGGLVQQMRVAFRLGHRIANSNLDPQWNPGEAFAQARGR